MDIIIHHGVTNQITWEHGEYTIKKVLKKLMFIKQKSVKSIEYGVQVILAQVSLQVMDQFIIK